jgi:CHASE3 domain sensor protein
VTDDALRSELDNLRKFFSHGVAELRGDIQAARTEAAEGHERLREDLSRRLSDAVEAKVRIRILEDNQKIITDRLDAEQKATTESNRFLWAQVIAASGVVAAIVGLIIAWRVHP